MVYISIGVLSHFVTFLLMKSLGNEYISLNFYIFNELITGIEISLDRFYRNDCDRLICQIFE